MDEQHTVVRLQRGRSQVTQCHFSFLYVLKQNKRILDSEYYKKKIHHLLIKGKSIPIFSVRI
jgi:hypothetical protein